MFVYFVPLDKARLAVGSKLLNNRLYINFYLTDIRLVLIFTFNSQQETLIRIIRKILNFCFNEAVTQPNVLHFSLRAGALREGKVNGDYNFIAVKYIAQGHLVN